MAPPLLLHATFHILGDSTANKADAKEDFLVQFVWGIMREEPDLLSPLLFRSVEGIVSSSSLTTRNFQSDTAGPLREIPIQGRRCRQAGSGMGLTRLLSVWDCS